MEHVLGVAVRDGDALGLLGDGGDGGVTCKVGDRGDARARRQLDQSWSVHRSSETMRCGWLSKGRRQAA